jgi:cysteine-rich repeat protein
MRGGLLVVSLLAALASRSGAKPVPCPPGRYIITQGAAIVVGDSAPAPGTIVIQGTQLALGSHCTLRNGSVHATKKGTRIKAQWPSCGALRGVKLSGLIQTDCTSMTGSVKAKKTKAQTFQARLSTCGDQVVDSGAGEACDSGVGCPAGQSCTADCHCVPLPTTTTPTSSTTTSTGVLCLPTTTTTTLAGKCGNGMVDPGETCDDGNVNDGDSCPHNCHIDSCIPQPASSQTVDVTFTPPAGKQVAGLTLLVDYPEGRVIIPGSGDDPAVVGSITHLPFGALSQPNDLDYALLESIVKGTALTPGRALTIQFETCACSTAPSAADFTCTVLDASDPDGVTVAGVTCAVVVP